MAHHPYAENQGMEERTLQLLEWQELCRQLANYALSARGGALCLALLPQSSPAAAREEMALTSEMVRVLEGRGLLPIEPLGDMEPLLTRVERGERLLGVELAQIGAFLESVAKIRAALLRDQARYPGLSALAQALDEAAALREGIRGAIDQEGNMKDDASPRLRALRREARQRREAILARLDGFLRHQEASRFLQDRYYTVREGRFVLPVRSEAWGHVGGIVHDISSSGATYFLEPPWLVELNNGLRVAELEVQKEVERILERLSRSVAVKAGSIRVDQEVLARLDTIQAKARLSQAVAGCEPVWAHGREVALRGLRHPLLVLRGKQVVANNIFLQERHRVMVISGPNAGGKTVLLKALGLAVLMARAGIYPPVEQGSRLGFFSQVFADIGDQQDLQQDFSTFSAHMRNIREILHGADEGSLVLLDELAGSTDPQEGAALALAVLEELLERGAVVVATTHYPQVKVWAQERDGAKNAAMEFDWEKLAPTYRLREGIPGQSSALEIARRMELPEEVLDLASKRLQGEELRLEALLREAQRERSALEEERGRLVAMKARLEELVARQEELVRGLRDERESFLREKRRRLSAEIQEARQRIREVMAGLSGARSPKEVHEARARLEEVAFELRGPLPDTRSPALPLGDARPGDPVEVVPLGQQGVLLDDPSSGKGKVRVQVGQMEVWVDVGSLGGVPSHGPDSAREKAGISSAVLTGEGVQAPRELDLRGMRADDALEELAHYLDRALLGPMQEVRIIHGHGTGALKRAVRQWLANCPWIIGFRPGIKGEGGDGVTVVELRAHRTQEGA